MIIKDVDGRELELTKNKLVEIDKLRAGYTAFYTTFGSIRKTHKGYAKNPKFYYHTIRCVNCNDREHIALLSYCVEKSRNIGCREFSPATFAKILKAAGVKPAAKKRAKKAVAR